MRDRTRTRVRLGHYPEVSLSEARKRAYLALGKEKSTQDEAAPSITFADAVKLFIDEHYKDKGPRTRHEATRLLNRFTRLHKLALSQVTDQEINVELAKLKDTPSEQLHAFRALRTFFRWCIRPPHRYIKHSPLEGYPAPGKDKKGTRILTDAELRKVWLACEGYFGDMIRLLILWGCRNGEIGRLKPEWRENGVMVIPGTHTKNSRAHAIPILPMARAILDRNKTNREYFFMGRTHDSHFNDGFVGQAQKGAR